MEASFQQESQLTVHAKNCQHQVQNRTHTQWSGHEDIWQAIEGCYSHHDSQLNIQKT